MKVYSLILFIQDAGEEANAYAYAQYFLVHVYVYTPFITRKLR